MWQRMRKRNGPWTMVKPSKIQQIISLTKKSLKGLWNMLPILIGVVMLMNLVQQFIPQSIYTQSFSGNNMIDPAIGSAMGSIFASNPIISYVIGGELSAAGVSLVAITAFIVAWVTVGLVQMPAESAMLGKRFSVWRNASAFIFAIIVSIITVSVVNTL